MDKKILLTILLIGTVSVSMFTGCGNKKGVKEDAAKPTATDTSKQTDTKDEVNKDTGNRLDKLKAELKKKGFEVGENKDVVFAMIGATNGYKFDVNGQQIEAYLYEENKLTEEGKEMLKQAKNGSISLSGINLKVDYINDFVVARLEEHKDKDKIIEVLKSIKNQ